MPDRTYAIFAQALSYPAPGQVQALTAGAESLPASAIRKRFQGFLQQIQALTLGEWEELYTCTFDLNPSVAPYVGYQIWGDSYKRGNFMALLNRKMHEEGVSPNGELPDHLGPVLNYLGNTSQPPVELTDVLAQSVERMLSKLRKSEPQNPYISLFEAISQAVGSLETNAKAKSRKIPA